MKNNKKGEMTSSHIIGLVLLIVALFVIIVFLVEIIEIYKKSPDEVCRLSILERATVPSAAQNYIPLKCSTKKICLSLGDDCPQFLAESFEKIDLSKLKTEKAISKIEETLANAQYDCWSITGRGQIDLTTGINKDLKSIAWNLVSIDQAEPACLICSRIAFSPKLQNSDILKNVNVLRYMKEEKVPGSDLTYLESFTGRQIVDYPSNPEPSLNFKMQLEQQGQKKVNQVAYVFTQVLVNKNDGEFTQAIEKGRNAGIIVGTTLLSPAGAVVSIPGSIIATIASATIAGGLAYYQGGKNQAFANAFCGQMTTSSRNPEGKIGCSIVAPTDYEDVHTLNKLCAGGILGSP